MAWTTPKTWASGYVVLAADLNTHLRDNLNVTAPAVLTTAGDILYASGSNTPARLAKSTTSTQYLANTGTSNIPAWNEVALATGVSGTLPVGNGGTGQTSLTTGAILIGNSTSAVTMVTQTTKGQILIGDGSGPPQMLAVGSNDYILTADSGETTGVKWAEAGAGAVVREGGNTTEATTTSGTAADLLTASSLTVAAAEPCLVIYNGRKTSGNASDGGNGLKINSTIIAEAAESESVRGYVNDAVNEAQSGCAVIWLSPRVTNYLSGALGMATRQQGTNRLTQTQMVLDELSVTAAIPNAEITDVIIRVNGGAGGPTWAADELQVYSFAAS